MAILSTLFGPWVSELDRSTLRVDAMAGLLGAVLVLPQAIAFAALVGLPPSYGLATAVLPCIVAALFGSSRHVMSGPTNANSLAMAAMVAPLAAVGSPAYIQLVLALTVLVGVLQLAVGALRLGALAHFISPAALRGFTGGAALLIAVHALKDLLGIVLPLGLSAPAALLSMVERLPQLNPGAVVVGVATIVAALAARRLWPRVPHLLLGMIAGMLAAAALARWAHGWHPVEVVGVVPQAWPHWQWPDVDWHRLPELLGLAIALTIIALGQSYSIAKVLSQRSGHYVDANREFLGQGLSNVVGGVFSCFLSCGSLNRSLPNLEAGARTPLASVFSALWLLVLVGLSAGIAAATLVATLAIRLELAILLGTLLSLAAYLWRTARPAMRTMGFDTHAAGRPFVIADDNPRALPECPQLKLLRMEGAVYFGATQHVGERLHALRAAPASQQHLLVMAKSMNFIDLAGDELWRDEMRQRRAAGGDLYFHRPRPPVMDLWQLSGFLDEMGRDHVFPDKRSAIATIVPRLDAAVCARCTVKLFDECPR